VVAARARVALATMMGAAALLAGSGMVGVSAGSPVAHVGRVSHATHEGSKISLRHTSHGSVLVGANGHTIYRFDADTKNHSNCNKACRKRWPPVTTTGKPHAGAGVSASHLGVIKGHQVTYYGHPLYTYFKDKKAGQLKGEQAFAFGNYWWLISKTSSRV
jgi:predicted lipoprotein with Yx(FWY)xxD motif